MLVPVRLDVRALAGEVCAGVARLGTWRSSPGGGGRSTVVAGAAVGRCVSEQERDRVMLDLVRTQVAAVLGHAHARWRSSLDTCVSGAGV